MSALRPGDITDEMIQAMDTAKFRRGTHHRIDHGFELRPRRQCYVGDGLGYGGKIACLLEPGKNGQTQLGCSFHTART